MNDVINSINNLSKSSSAAIKNLYKINTNLVEQLTEQQMAMADTYLECATNQLGLLNGEKSYSEVVAGQAQIISEVGEKFQGIGKNTVDIVNESMEEIGAWLEKGAKDVAKATTTATKVVKNVKAV